jgi:hypothetical protein
MTNNKSSDVLCNRSLTAIPPPVESFSPAVGLFHYYNDISNWAIKLAQKHQIFQLHCLTG